MSLLNTIARIVLLSIVLSGIAPLAYSTEKPEIANAAQQRQSTKLAELIENKADPNIAQTDGMTALLWAAYHDDFATAEQLIEAGAEVQAANRYGITPLSLACTNGNSELTKLLLDNGADANTTQSGGETMLMLASRTGRLNVVQALVAGGAQVNARQRSGQTALMWAAAEGHAAVVAALLEAGADYTTPLSSGFTPLSFAVRNGHIDVTQRLIAAEVDVNEAMTKARGGRGKPVKNTSPLLLAMENGHFELAEILLQAGADPNDERTGFAPLFAMSWIRKPEKGDNESGTPPPTGSGKLTSLQFVHKLVEHGAEVNLRKSSNGGGRLRISVKDTTPFLCAAATADVAYMKTLLQLGADPELKNDRDQTALMMASGIDERPEGDGPGSKAEHLAAVKFLLDHESLPKQDINATDNDGETAMHGAAYKSLPKVVELLDQRGADIDIWSKPTRQGRTPLRIAQGYRPGNFKPSFETVAAIKKVMLAHGVTPPPPPGERDEQYRD